MTGENPAYPLALGVPTEELQAIETCFTRVSAATDTGERVARVRDLVRALDRYLRLEAEVLLPALAARTGRDAEHAKARHGPVLAAMGRLSEAGYSPAGLEAVRAAFSAYRRDELPKTFQAAGRLPRAELDALAYELDEVRNRMRGAYGV